MFVSRRNLDLQRKKQNWPSVHFYFQWFSRTLGTDRDNKFVGDGTRLNADF